MNVPIATYRLQFTDKFTFRQAEAIVDYLAALGISDIYAAPIMKAKDRSVSGYDVVDPHRINPELGTTEDFESIAAKVKSHRMGWLQDIVPNHMGYYGSNRMLADVLEKGSASKYFNYFDVDWNHPYESLRGRLLAPFLGRFYGQSLEDGEIQLQYCEPGFFVHYYDFNFPLRLESYAEVITFNWSRLRRSLKSDHPDFIKLCGLLYVLKNLPPQEDTDELYDQVAFTKRMLWELYTGNEEFRQFLDGNIHMFNGEKGKPESFRPLDRLLSDQHYRLSFWKVATEEIDYRRFFTINDLISLNMEPENVYRDIHSFTLELLGEGKLTGLRVDHIDGLHDPTMYLERLRQSAGDAYIVVEKILDLDEDLPSFWTIQGTTGYEFINFVNGIFCRRESEEHFSRLFLDFAGFDIPYEEVWYSTKKTFIERHMMGDMSNLARLLKNALSEDRHGGDITLYGFQRAITEVLAHFPVYRTYVSATEFRPSARAYIEEAIRKSRAMHPHLTYELDFIRKVLLLEFEDYLSKEEKQKRLQFVMRFQQFTGPLMAKGFEDTTLYVYNRFLGLNEVGSSPQEFGVPLERFHQFNSRRAAEWPHSMSATATHDTKRGEDVRARLNVLSELPGEWEERITRWSDRNASRKKWVEAVLAPDRNTEYLLYQTLVGAYPFEMADPDFFLFRIKEYMFKAVREAKVHSEWVNPNAAFEEALYSFIEGILQPSDGNAFLDDFLPFHKKVAAFGIWNSLSQVLIKTAAPGVPDFYQGTELWDLSLVDPDNRRPVDYEKRKSILDEVLRRERDGNLLPFIEELLATRHDGRIKLFLIHRALLARKRQRLLFEKGDYIPLGTRGAWKDHLVAFARRSADSWALAIAPRFLTSVVGEGKVPVGEHVWGDTAVELPDGAPVRMEDAVTGQKVEASGTLRASAVFNHFPVALLLSEEKR